VFTADYFKDPEAMTNHDIDVLTYTEKVPKVVGILVVRFTLLL